MLDELTLTSMDDLFTVKKYDVIPYERQLDNWISVSFEMDLNMIRIERKLYTVFDMLSDVGGLLGILMAFAASLNSIWNYQNFDNFMVSRLFKIKRPKNEIEEDAGYFEQSDYIELNMLPNLRNWCLSCVPKYCFCCAYSRKEKAL